MKRLAQLGAFLAFALALPCGPARAQPGAPKEALKTAGQRFEEGQTFYNKGQYAEAINAFTAAHQLAPHWRSLFNIARCHENLGRGAQAIEFYRQALAHNPEAADRADIEGRIARLSSRPVKVFVSSLPTGAQVTVDGRAAPEAGQTPLVVELAPGEHLLLLRREGHHLAAQRVVVEMDKELPVQVKLEPLPAPCPPSPRPCPVPKPCPKESLVEVDALHVHVSIMGAFALTSDRPMAAGPGVQVYATYRRIFFGTHFLGLPVGEEQIDHKVDISGTPITLNKATSRWLAVQVEGGYVFPFRHFFVYATFGAGLSADRITFDGKDTAGKVVESPVVREGFAGIWSVGGGIEAMALPWLSFGAAIRGGGLHGKRADKDEPMRDPKVTNAPYGSLWGTLAFHL